MAKVGEEHAAFAEAAHPADRHVIGHLRFALGHIQAEEYAYSLGVEVVVLVNLVLPHELLAEHSHSGVRGFVVKKSVGAAGVPRVTGKGAVDHLHIAIVLRKWVSHDSQRFSFECQHIRIERSVFCPFEKIFKELTSKSDSS